MPPYQGQEGSFSDINYKPTEGKEGLDSQPLDPLQLEIPDDKLNQIIDDRVEDSHTFYEEVYHLSARRRKNEVAYFGRDDTAKDSDKITKDYESKYQDNVLYEIMGTIKPLGMSRVPDLMATPGNDSEEAVLMAQEVSLAIDSEIKERQNRFVLGLAYKHLPVYFTGVIKVWWNPEIDDYEFGVIHPNLIEVDHTCPTNNADQMKVIPQIVPLTVHEIMMRFPNKKDEFLEQLKSEGLVPGENPSWHLLATVIKIREVWFHEYIEKENNLVERVDGVVWKYKKVILAKMKNPNFDYEGETRYFAFDQEDFKGDKRALNEQELSTILMTGQLPPNVKKEQVYHNYFRFPRKPFYFMGYDQWGKQPYDETSWMEQNLENQRSINKRGQQIEQTLNSRGHHILAKDAVTPAELEEIDWEDPNLDLSVAGNPAEKHAFIAAERPSAEEFNEITNLRERSYAIAHSTATRGEIKAEAPATSNQIAREGDFTAADDMVEDTINPAAQWMGEWAMQFIKLRYTEDHFRWIMGVAGEAVYLKLNRNMVMDGMMVKVKASGTDKIRAQNNAIDMAKMGLIDPYTFYTDMGLSDPEGRTEKAVLFKLSPQAYMQKVVKGLNTSEALAKALMEQEIPSQPSNIIPPQPASPAQPLAPQSPVPGQPQPAPQAPSPQNTADIPQTPVGPPQASPRVL